MKNKVNHNNIFESYIAQDLFILDIIDRIASDWKEADRQEFTRDNFEDFIFEDFSNWMELGLQEYSEEEFGEEDEM